MLPPDLYKIDIEGAEVLALGGMRELTASLAVEILVEVHLKFLAEFNHSIADFDNIVKKIGYKKLWLEKIDDVSSHYWIYR